jgi:DNA-directed RNA polymerase II subunit RPB2
MTPEELSSLQSMIVDESGTIKELANDISEKLADDFEKTSADLLGHIGDYTTGTFAVIESYFKDKVNSRVVRHQIESMNHFYKHQMQATIDMFNPRRVVSESDYNSDTGDHNLSITYSITNIKFHPPQLHENNGATKPMYPHEARLRNFTYASKTTVDIVFTVNHRYNTDKLSKDINATTTSTFTIPGLKFIDIPIMVGSCNCIVEQYRRNFGTNAQECPLDSGGYFIIKGTEKVVIGQEHAAENQPHVYASKKPKWDWVMEYRSVPDNKCISPKQMEMAVSSKANLYGHGIHVMIPRMRAKTSIELFVLFRALGVASDRQICDIIMLGVDDSKKEKMLRFLEASIYDAAEYMPTNLHEYDKLGNHVGINHDPVRRAKHDAAICEAAFSHFMTVIPYTTIFTKTPDKKKDEKHPANPEVASYRMQTVAHQQHQPHEITKQSSPEEYRVYMQTLFLPTLNQLDRYRTQHENTYQTGSFSSFFLQIIRCRKNHTKSKDRRKEYTSDILANELFPHCKTLTQKIYLLGMVANRLIQTALGWIEPADRDSYQNKRIELSGTLINNLFRNLFSRFVKEFDRHIIREINHGTWNDPEQIIHHTNIHRLFVPNTVENGSNRALSTGDFSVKQSGGNNKVGVAQVLNRLNNAAVLSHLRRINTPLEKTGELIAPRKLHGTTAGFLCPIETPEGQSVGVVKQLAMMTHVTIPVQSQSNAIIYAEVAQYIEPLSLDEPAQKYNRKVKVIVNGTWVGITNDPVRCYAELKDRKYRGIFNIYISIVFDIPKLEIRICSDGGRMCRPLFRVRNGRALITAEHVHKLMSGELDWDDLLISGHKLPEAVIEYIDVNEQAYAKIGMRLDANRYLHDVSAEQSAFGALSYTHCEIHPSLWFGLIASCIPFPHLNQSPRNAYQTAMGKQAMGITSTVNNRMDKTAYRLEYPSRPLVNTRMADILQMNRLPAGCQVHVAIMSFTGYNQEDSVLINQAAIDRGMFATTVYHTEKDDDKGSSRDEVIRCVPDPHNTRGMKLANYSKLVKQTGFMRENDLVENRDVYNGKKSQIKENRGEPSQKLKYEDQSKVFRTNENNTYINKNYVGRNGDGYNFSKTQFRTYRRPNIGDKFASRSAQKGTAGKIVLEKDMPFTAEGIRPDVIINPHCIPSRMTISQMVEHALGNLLVELGVFGDGTCFGDMSADHLVKALQQVGFESHGNHIMYDGHTGQQFEVSTFMGPVYYQRLKHMVNDKEHSRAIGPMVNLTRQPADGRSRDGGFRIGEMERDVFIAHGVPEFCMDRMYYCSDKYGVHVCKKCGMIATYNDGKGTEQVSMKHFTTYECRMCKNTVEFGYVRLPYAAKLLFQELQTINISPRIMIE